MLNNLRKNPPHIEPAVAAVSADNFASAPGIVIAAAVASTGTAVHEPAVVVASLNVFAPAPHSAATENVLPTTHMIRLRGCYRHRPPFAGFSY